MKNRWRPTIRVNKKHLPKSWQEKLIKDGKLGGVLLVLVEGTSREEVDKKVVKIKEFCTNLKRGMVSV